MTELVNKKVYVGKFSKEIQEKAFKLGFVWKTYYSEEQEINYLEAPFLFFYPNKKITYESDLKHFNNHEFEEVVPEWILNLPENTLKNEIIKNFHITKKGKIIKDFPYISSEQQWFRQFNREEVAIAYKHLPELLYWRDKYNEGWYPDWNNDGEKYVICLEKNKVIESCTYTYSKTLIFKTRKIRDKFLEDFKELIEKCKPLL